MSRTVVDLSFEDALGELDTLLKGFEEGQLSLEKAMDAYERGIALKTHCEQRLKEARLRVEKLMHNGDQITAKPFQA